MFRGPLVVCTYIVIFYFIIGNLQSFFVFHSVDLFNLDGLDKHSQRGLSKHFPGDLKLKTALKLMCVSQNIGNRKEEKFLIENY